MPIPVEAGIGCRIVYEGGAEEGRPERKRFDSVPPPEAVAESSSSSSIGENSDGPGVVGAGVDGQEVQSGFNGALESLDALKESLPMRRGISKFYRGKSKSFTSLSDAASSSAKDLGKADNTYSRKRKNLLAYKTIWECSHLLRNTGGSISKRSANPQRSTVVMSNCNNNGVILCLAHPLPPLNRPGKPACVASAFGSPPVKRCCFSMRSFSMADLQGATSSSPSMGPADERKMFS